MQENNKKVINVSPLGKTWILDLDGTIVKHNGYKIDGHDTFLEGAQEFLKSIPQEDMIVFITSRTDEYMEMTKNFLSKNDIRYNSIIPNAPYGERILINDTKLSGLETAIAINTKRDIFMENKFNVCDDL